MKIQQYAKHMQLGAPSGVDPSKNTLQYSDSAWKMTSDTYFLNFPSASMLTWQPQHAYDIIWQVFLYKHADEWKASIDGKNKCA